MHKEEVESSLGPSIQKGCNWVQLAIVESELYSCRGKQQCLLPSNISSVAEWCTQSVASQCWDVALDFLQLALRSFFYVVISVFSPVPGSAPSPLGPGGRIRSAAEAPRCVHQVVQAQTRPIFTRPSQPCHGFPRQRTLDLKAVTLPS